LEVAPTALGGELGLRVRTTLLIVEKIAELVHILLTLCPYAHQHWCETIRPPQKATFALIAVKTAVKLPSWGVRERERSGVKPLLFWDDEKTRERIYVSG